MSSIQSARAGAVWRTEAYADCPVTAATDSSTFECGDERFERLIVAAVATTRTGSGHHSASMMVDTRVRRREEPLVNCLTAKHPAFGLGLGIGLGISIVDRR